MFLDIIGAIIGGAIIGALARLLIPGKQSIGILITIAIGIVGSLIGYWLSGVLGVASTPGPDWIRWAISIAVAVVLVLGYTAVTRKSGPRV
ncbi:MAG: GlsB/YeaQ/YmgE family stress response membrane protein [Mycobacterium sp.]